MRNSRVKRLQACRVPVLLTLMATVMVMFMLMILAAGCGNVSGRQNAGRGPDWKSFQKTGSMKLQYAEMFSVDYYAPEAGADGASGQAVTDGQSAEPYALVTIGPPEQQQDQCLVIPEGMPVPGGLDEEIIPVQRPLDHVYLAASSAMDFWCRLDALDAVTMTSTKEQDWSLPEVREAIREGRMEYAGKYSAPDHERLLRTGCRLAIESTMIWHSPETAEKLESMGIPVLVERSSYEPHPLGRMEWIRFYGLLAGRQEEADRFFAQKVKQLDSILSGEMKPSGKTAAFFYITASGNANIRKPGDYVTKMIELAGGTYAFTELPAEENAMSTMNLQMEQFYRQAKDADILIYNSTIDGGLSDLDDLLQKSNLFSGFAAVKNGDVWCTGKNMFQETTCASDMILELHSIFSGEAGDGESLRYLHKMK